MILNEEIVTYFKKEDGFTRLFFLFGEKIKSLNTVGGSVLLTHLTATEQRLIGRWMGEDFSKKTSVTISLKKFEKRFLGTKFEGSDLRELISMFLGDELIYKKDQKEQEEQSKKEYFLNLSCQYDSEFTQIVTQLFLEGKTFNSLNAAYNRREFKELEVIYKALSQLDMNVKKRLSVFAEQITGNPHAFDNEPRLISALQMIRCYLEGVSYVPVQSAEETHEVFFDFGILKDDISNFVTCCGMLAKTKKGSLLSWEYASLENEVQNVPLKELNKIDSIAPRRGNIVFIFENSGVFSEIKDRLDAQGISCALVCTHGQFKIAGLTLINKLVASGTKIYYAGDYDPEGLQMAWRLKNRYPDHVNCWRYSKEDYLHAISHMELTKARISKLENVNGPEFEDIIIEMKRWNRAGYQEKMIDYLLEDIENFSKKEQP